MEEMKEGRKERSEQVVKEREGKKEWKKRNQGNRRNEVKGRNEGRTA